LLLFHQRYGATLGRQSVEESNSGAEYKPGDAAPSLVSTQNGRFIKSKDNPDLPFAETNAYASYGIILIFTFAPGH